MLLAMTGVMMFVSKLFHALLEFIILMNYTARQEGFRIKDKGYIAE